MERLAVPRGVAVAAYGLYVLRRGVAHVAVPAVFGVIGSDGAHEFIPVSLCQNRSGGNAGIGGISMHYGPEVLEAVPVKRPELVAVDEQEFRRRVQPQDCPLHACDRGPQDIQGVYFRGAYGLYGPGDSFPLNDGAKLLTGLFRHLFGVIEEGVAEVFRQNDRGRIHGPGKRPAAGFIAAGLKPPGFQILLQ